MGRTHFKSSIVPRAYVAWPHIRIQTDPAAGTDFFPNPITPGASSSIELVAQVTTSANQRYSAAPDSIAGFIASRRAASVQAMMWSLLDTYGGDINVGASANSMSLTSAHSGLTVQAAATHPNGVLFATRDPSGPSGTPGLAAPTRGNSDFGPYFDVDVAEKVRCPWGANILTRNFLHPLGQATTVDAPGPVTHFPGCVTGFYGTIPLGEVSGAERSDVSGTINDVGTTLTTTTWRRVTAPYNFRVQSILFNYVASAAGNTAKIRNLTTGVDICAMTALTSATPASTEVTAANLSNRNITKGDKIAIRATCGATGFTSLGAVLVGHVTGHVNADPLCDYSTHGADNTFEDYVSRRGNSIGTVARQHFSGPCTGGTIALPLVISALAAGTGLTNTVLSTFKAPMDLYALGVQYGTRASAAGNSLNIYNSTKAVQLVSTAITGGTPAGTNNGWSLLANNAISKGDMIQLRATTGGTAGFSMAGAVLYAWVRGHVNTVPSLD